MNKKLVHLFFAVFLVLAALAVQSPEDAQAVSERMAESNLLLLAGDFGKISPVNGAVGQPRTITLSWTSSSLATGYEYCYDTTFGGECLGTWTSVGMNTSVTLTFPAGDVFYWHVRATKAGGGYIYAESSASAKWTLNILPNPGDFNKVGPANSATGIDPGWVNLSWTSSSNAAVYEFCLDTTNNSNCDTGWNNWGITLDVYLWWLSPGTTYYWQVRTSNINGNTYANGGTWWSFTTQPVPASFVKLTPGNGATGLPKDDLVLSWAPSAGATKYEYCYNKDSTICVLWHDVGTGTSTMISGLDPGAHYFWQVRATNISGEVYANSGTWFDFYTLPIPGSFTKLEPADLAVDQDDIPLFSWEPSSDAATYRICVDDVNNDICDWGWNDFGGLTEVYVYWLWPDTYYWQVEASNANGSVLANGGDWWEFTVQPFPGAFSKTNPPNLTTGLSNNGLHTDWYLNWGASADAGFYEYCYDTIDNGYCDTAWISTGAEQQAALSTLTPGTTYYWQVRAINQNGMTEANSGAWWSFTTRLTPDPFERISPWNGQSGLPKDGLTLEWSESYNADYYWICLSTDLMTCTWYYTGSNRSWTISGLTPGQTYFWYVEAWNGDGLELSSGGLWWSFVVLPVPGAFSKTTPVDTATNQPINDLFLGWDWSSDSWDYEYCLNTAPSCPGDVWTSAPWWSPTGDYVSNLNPGITYYWQVRAKNVNGTTYANGGDWWEFTTLPKPGTFTKSSPSNGSIGQPTSGLVIDWNLSTAADSYEYCVSSSATCTSGIWTSTGPALSAVLNNLLPGTTYYWQVRARNDSGTTEANGGTWWNFTTFPFPGPFNKLAPPDGSTGLPKDGLQLSWSVSSNATGYQYCLQSSPVCPAGSWVDVGSSTTVTLPGLTAGQTYYWQVRSYNLFGYTTASDPWWSFTTLPAPGAFNKTWPLNGAINQVIDWMYLEWETSTNVEYYEYCYDTINDGACNTQWHNNWDWNWNYLFDLTPGTWYYWQVRAVNMNGTTYANGGNWWSFQTRPLPSPFSKIGPANGATGQPTDGLLLEWNGTAHADYYEYCISLTATCADVDWVSTGLGLTSMINGLEEDTTYYWQVRAVNFNGMTYADVNTWWSFKTLARPRPFNKFLPANGAIDQPKNNLKLTWEASSYATGYEYCVHTSPSCPGDIWTSVGSNLEATIGGLTPNVTYYWQVRAWNVYGTVQANSDSWWSFTTMPVPGAFNKSSPGNGTTGHPKDGLVLSWGSSSKAQSYYYCYDTVLNGACSTQWNGPVTSLSATLNGLAPGTWYEWQVRADNINGTTYANAGTWWTFQTLPVPGAFNKINPSNGFVGAVAAGLNLTWGSSTNAASYEYCIDTTLNGSCGSSWISTGTNTFVNLNLVEDTWYEWQVRAKNINGETFANSGTWWTFKTWVLPDPFNKTAPANGLNSLPKDGLVLSWAVSNQATWYEYCYDTTDNDACDTSWTDTGTIRTATLNGLTPGTWYYWQVQACTIYGCIDANGGDWWSFRPLPVPGAFNKSAPANASEGQAIDGLSLTWTASDYVSTYAYCLSSTASCQSEGAWVSTGTSRSITLNNLAPGTTYYWQVRGTNINGTTYADSGWWSFTTRTTPNPFDKVAPVHNSTGLPINGIELSWNASSNVTSYEYCVNTSATCPGSWTSVNMSLTTMLNGLAAGETYYWQVRARNSSGTTDANGGWWTFVTLPAPGQFSKNTPANNATKVPVSSLDLNWGTSTNASSYEYCFNTTPSCPGSWTSTLTATSANITGLTPGVTYYWQVRARNINGVTTANLGEANNGWWTFTTLPVPGAFSKTAPANGSQQSMVGLTLNWGTSSDAASYKYCIDTNNNNACDGSWVSVGTDLSVAPSGLVAGTTYYWQVQAINSSGTVFANSGEPNSGWWNFTTLAMPGAFNKTAPANNSTNQPLTGLQISWATSSNATKYEYCLSTTPTCAGPWTDNGNALTATLGILKNNTKYYWQVRAWNQTAGPVYANGSETAMWSFSTPYKIYMPAIIYEPFYPVTGQITLNGVGMSGVTVTATGGHTALTDASGNYSFSLLQGTYTLTPTKPDYTFTPASKTITVPPAASGQNFTAAKVPVCEEYVDNGGFESTGDWTLSNANYSTTQKHSGSRSVQIIRTSLGFASAQQTITVPSNIEGATLRFWMYSVTGDTSVDYQTVRVLYPGSTTDRTLLQQLSNAQTWEQKSFNLSEYAGKTITLYFGVYNDGIPGTTSMYIDDVSLEVCK